MKDRDIVLAALNEAALIIGDYLEPGLPRDPAATIHRLVKVLDGQELAQRSSGWNGLKVVK
jgi:hypothetical protein